MIFLFPILFLSFTSLSQTRIVIRPKFDNSTVQQIASYPFQFQKRPRVALVLSGGGARGATQIGVLKAFEKHNIPIDFIAATSMGSIVGGLYASGYTPAEIESLALTTDWDDVLSLSEDTKRTELFVDQKLQHDRSFLVVRFQGFEPVIPAAISSGQRLTNFLSTQTLQALYHPNPSFDDLKVKFRAATTDLISGRRVVLSEGSLAEALRASATVPLVFNPVKKDSMQLIDGGLITNIPVDLARKEGYEIIIAVNSTSGLRNAEELKAPWQTADQIMGIMMQLPNEASLKDADVIITPQMGKHLSSDFKGLDTLIRKGEEAAELVMEEIISLYHKKLGEIIANPNDTLILPNPGISVAGQGIPDSVRLELERDGASGQLTVHDVQDRVSRIFDLGDFSDVYAVITMGGPTIASDHLQGSIHTSVVYHVTQHPRVQEVTFIGCNVIAREMLRADADRLVGLPLNAASLRNTLETILREYRQKGFSLARIESALFDTTTGILSIHINEGIIGKIDVQGGVRAEDSFILREFPMHEGEVFRIDRANQGVTNINSTTLFEYVYLEVLYAEHDPLLRIRLKERPSQLVRLGLRIDDERNVQASLDVRDENFRGLGAELGVNLSGGSRNKEAVLEFKAHRLFTTYLTFNVSGIYSSFDSYFYGDAPKVRENRWDRLQLGEYRDERYGGRLTFGTQLEKLGNATIDYSLQQVRIKDRQNAAALQERYRLSMIRIGTTIDSKDSYPFPTNGFGMNVSYEFALEGLGSQVAYNALRFTYESYSSWGVRHTFHPKFTLGFADRTMPLGEQFRLGGRESMFGTREDDRRGRQILLVNVEYRYHLPIRILFDSYVGMRFDMGSISVVPEEIKFATLRYGIGAMLGLDTPVGPATLSVGKSFYFGRDLPDNPIQHGPFLFYFMVGYQL